MIAIIEENTVKNVIVATMAEAQIAFPDATLKETESAGIGWKLVGDALGAPAIDVQLESTRLAIQIDADVDALYAAALGNRQSEYELAEAQATTYKAAGYAGTVPASVASWAGASGMTAKAACDNILAQAAGWRQAQIAIRAQRLGLKAAAKKAASETELQAVQAQWAGFLVQIKKMLGV